MTTITFTSPEQEAMYRKAFNDYIEARARIEPQRQALFQSYIKHVFIIAKFTPTDAEYAELTALLTQPNGPGLALSYCTHMLGVYTSAELEQYFSEGSGHTMSDVVPNDYVTATIHPFSLAYSRPIGNGQPIYFLQRRPTNILPSCYEQNTPTPSP